MVVSLTVRLTRDSNLFEKVICDARALNFAPRTRSGAAFKVKGNPSTESKVTWDSRRETARAGRAWSSGAAYSRLRHCHYHYLSTTTTTTITDLDELLLRKVLALPYASVTGLHCKIRLSRLTGLSPLAAAALAAFTVAASIERDERRSMLDEAFSSEARTPPPSEAVTAEMI